MHRKISFAAIAMFVSTTVASAQVTLQIKYTEGSKYEVQSESKTKQTLSFLGMDIDTASTTFIRSMKKVAKRDSDGNLKVEEKIESLQTDMSLPGGVNLAFDSANPNKEAPRPELEPIMEVFRAITSLPVTVEFDSKNRVVSAKLPEGEFEKLPQEAKDRFSPEALKKLSEQAIDFLPDGPVKKGDSWERSSENKLGGGQTLSFRTKFEYVGTVEKDGKMLDKIIGKVIDVSYSLDANPMIQVTKSDLKATESETTILFNREQGNAESKNSKVKIAGSLTIVANNMEFPGKVDLTLEEKVTRQK